MNTATRSKKSAALLIVAAVLLAVGGPRAQAGQTGPVPLTVSTTISAPCTVTTAGTLQFPGYTSGQAPAVLGTMLISITCPTSSVLGPIPVTLDFVPVVVGSAVGFEMSQGGTGAPPFLPYKLCDTSCATGTVYGNGTAGPPQSITTGAGTTLYTLHGQIAGGLSPAASATAYSQRVNAYVNY